VVFLEFSGRGEEPLGFANPRFQAKKTSSVSDVFVEGFSTNQALTNSLVNLHDTEAPGLALESMCSKVCALISFSRI
jgi:hypothetical protein